MAKYASVRLICLLFHNRLKWLTPVGLYYTNIVLVMRMNSVQYFVVLFSSLLQTIWRGWVSRGCDPKTWTDARNVLGWDPASLAKSHFWLLLIPGAFRFTFCVMLTLFIYLFLKLKVMISLHFSPEKLPNYCSRIFQMQSHLLSLNKIHQPSYF